MKLVTTRRTPTAPVAINPLAVAVLQRYGDTAKMLTTWSPDNLQAISANVEKSVSAKVPELALMIAAYGKEVIIKNIAVMAAYAFSKMGETSLEWQDAIDVAEQIVEDMEARQLNYAFVVTFFAELKKGKFELYGVKTYQILRAFQKWLDSSLSRQRTLAEKVAREEADKAFDEYCQNAISWDEYKTKNGLSGDSPLARLP